MPSSSDCPPTCGLPFAACSLPAVGSPAKLPPHLALRTLGGRLRSRRRAGLTKGRGVLGLVAATHGQRVGGVKVQGTANQPRAILRASPRAFSGIEGGADATPRQPRCMTPGRLAETPNSGTSQPGGAAENDSPGTARNSTHRAVAGKGLSVASITDGGGDGHPVTLPGDSDALWRPPLFGLPVPLGNPRSSIPGDPMTRRLPEISPVATRKPPVRVRGRVGAGKH